MTQNPNDDITMETLENQITLEALDYLIINTLVRYNKIQYNNMRYSEKKRPDENSIFEWLNKTLEITKRLLIVGDPIVKNIEPYKVKKSTKYVTTVKSIIEVMIIMLNY